MHARFFDVLHDSGYQHVLPIAQSIHIHFGRILEKSIDQDRTLNRKMNCLLHVAPDRVFVVSDDHGAASQYVAGPHQYRESQPARDFARFFDAGGGAVSGSRDTQLTEELSE